MCIWTIEMSDDWLCAGANNLKRSFDLSRSVKWNIYSFPMHKNNAVQDDAQQWFFVHSIDRQSQSSQTRLGRMKCSLENWRHLYRSIVAEILSFLLYFVSKKNVFCFYFSFQFSVCVPVHHRIFGKHEFSHRYLLYSVVIRQSIDRARCEKVR